MSTEEMPVFTFPKKEHSQEQADAYKLWWRQVAI